MSRGGRGENARHFVNIVLDLRVILACCVATQWLYQSGCNPETLNKIISMTPRHSTCQVIVHKLQTPLRAEEPCIIYPIVVSCHTLYIQDVSCDWWRADQLLLDQFRCCVILVNS